MKRRTLLVGSLPAAMLPLAWAGSEEGTRLLRFSLTLRNRGLEPLRDQRVWLYMPLRDSGTQRLRRLQIGADHQPERDALGHSLVRLDWAQVPPMASRVVTIEAEVCVRSSPSLQSLADTSEWLRPERFIDSDDAGIRELAAQLKRDSPRATLDAVYDWVRSHLRYAGYLADTRGAVQALTDRSGDCTEYACLAVALARAAGIPARLMGGYVAGGNVAPRATDYHDWAEVHLDGAWHVLDAQKECWQQPSQDYVAFRIYRDPSMNAMGAAQRFRVEGDIEVRM